MWKNEVPAFRFCRLFDGPIFETEKLFENLCTTRASPVFQLRGVRGEPYPARPNSQSLSPLEAPFHATLRQFSEVEVANTFLVHVFTAASRL